MHFDSVLYSADNPVLIERARRLFLAIVRIFTSRLR
jgi:hypothetical protein